MPLTRVDSWPAKSVQLVEEPPRPCTKTAVGAVGLGPGVRRTCSVMPPDVISSPGQGGIVRSSGGSAAVERGTLVSDCVRGRAGRVSGMPAPSGAAADTVVIPQ